MRRRLLPWLLLGLVLCAACDDAPDSYAPERAQLAWEQSRADAARWDGIKTTGATGLILLAGLGLLWAAVALALDLRGTYRGQAFVRLHAAGQDEPIPYQLVQRQPGIVLDVIAGAQHVALSLAEHSSAVPGHLHYEYNATATGADVPALPAPVLDLPGPCSLRDVMRGGFVPGPDAILLGLGPGGQRITVPADDTMCHLLIAGPTGRGKSALFRLIMTQLILAGLDVIWLDPNYSPFDTKRRIDLRPLAARVRGGGPVVDVAAIEAVFRHLAGPELVRRQAARRATGTAGSPLFVFADEWPHLIRLAKGMADPAATCLRLYRQLDGYFAVGSQDGLVETMGLNSGELSQFATRYYLGGGDPTTRRRLTGATTNPDPPGKGIVWLSAAPLARPQEVRVPYVSNADMYELLGWPSAPPPWGWEGTGERARVNHEPRAVWVPEQPEVAEYPPPVAESSRVAAAVAGVAAPQNEGEKALALWATRLPMAKVVEQVRGVNSSQGQRYQTALKEIQEAMWDALEAQRKGGA